MAQANTQDKPNMSISGALTTGYRPRVHVVGGTDKVVMNMFKDHGYRVLNEKDEAFTWADTDIAVFPGGVADIHPKFYGQAYAGANHADLERDELEIDWFHLYEDKPKVGICRGLQLINILNGGKLVQHVPHHNGYHKIFDKWEQEVIASSAHHQVCIPAVSSQVIAWSKDISEPGKNDPEVIWYPVTNSFGVQGHPEWGPVAFTEYFFLLLKYFIGPLVKNPNAETKH